MLYFEQMKRPRPSHALQFILLMGLVSLLSDMTHEGARSLVGPFLSMTGASAANIGFVLGLGELLGTSLILLTAYIADQTKQYWLMTFMGYAINLIVIPSLALVPENGWIFACGLLLIERIGRAIRKPSKSTLVSFASKEMGEGKSFAILEFVDQIGAFLGPVLLFVVLWFKGEGTHLEAYHLAFFILGIPALLTLLVLWVAFKNFPHPEQFEKEEVTQDHLLLKKDFTFYLIAVALFAFGFIDFPIISMHFLKLNLIPFSWIPLLYACAMLVDAFAALIFGVGLIALA